jgi:DNA-binding NtrC family response regulator
MSVHAPVPYELIGSSDLVRDCAAGIDRAAGDERNVLITGERGLDLESIARSLHARSARKAGPFVVASTDGGVGDSERGLFGTVQRGSGASGVATLSAASAVYRANGGVLFVPNVGDLPAGLQRRLARLLRDAEARLPRRAGPVTLDVRVVASTESGVDGLRDDLARRFPVLIEIPALRRRREDVPAIAEAVLASRGLGHKFTPAALIVLAALPWRRNTAELSGLIERLTAGNGESLIRQEDVLAEVQLDRTPLRASGNLRDARRQFEREYIASVLRAHEWQMRDAARALGIERANLYRKARQLGIPLRRDSDAGASGATR